MEQISDTKQSKIPGELPGGETSENGGVFIEEEEKGRVSDGERQRGEGEGSAAEGS